MKQKKKGYNIHGKTVAKVRLAMNVAEFIHERPVTTQYQIAQRFDISPSYVSSLIRILKEAGPVRKYIEER